MRRHHTISNTDNIIDSRDVITRVDELESELQDTHEEAVKEWDDDDADVRGPQPSPDFDTWLEARADEDDDARELLALRALAAEGEDYAPDWRHGEALIRDDYFTTYAQQFADDIGAINREATWPLCHIDWDAAAESLKQNYSAIDYDGVSYWVRS